MRAGFELYRVFDQDVADNRGQSRIKVPVLALAGEHSVSTTATDPMTAEVARHATVTKVPAAGHWMAEETVLGLIGSAKALYYGFSAAPWPSTP